MTWIDAVGYLAAVCTTVSFLPQAVKTLRTKDTSSISLSMYAVFTFGTAAWLAFGVLSGNRPVMIANAITLVLASLILYLKIKYR